MSIAVDQKACPQNHPCPAIGVCPVEALTQKGHDAPEVDADKCTDCGACSSFCPMGALRLE